jgi:hypothetical protein
VIRFYTGPKTIEECIMQRLQPSSQGTSARKAFLASRGAFACFDTTTRDQLLKTFRGDCMGQEKK